MPYSVLQCTSWFSIFVFSLSSVSATTFLLASLPATAAACVDLLSWIQLLLSLQLLVQAEASRNGLRQLMPLSGVSSVFVFFATVLSFVVWSLLGFAFRCLFGSIPCGFPSLNCSYRCRSYVVVSVAPSTPTANVGLAQQPPLLVTVAHLAWRLR